MADKTATPDRVTFHEAFAKELTKIEKPSKSLVGLALSGGGIRSATFNLGFLQGLAKAGLLRHVHYLSTVSGGGYIGAWLISWIRRAGGVQAVESELGKLAPQVDRGTLLAEPRPVSFLRDYSNYLTPRKGIFGADIWAAIATYLRNLLLNLTVLILLLAAVVFLPWLFGGVALHVSQLDPRVLTRPFAILVFAFIAIVLVVVWKASGQAQATSSVGVAHKKWSEQKYVLWLLVVPLFSSSLLLAIGFWHMTIPWNWKQWAIAGAILYAAGHSLGLMARRQVLREAKEPRNQCPGVTPAPISSGREMAPQTLSLTRYFWIPTCGLGAGAVGGLLLSLAYELFAHWKNSTTSGIWHALSWGPPIFVLILMVTASLHIGLLKFLIPSQEHEWWARFGGLLLLVALGWTALLGLSIFTPLAAAVYSGWIKTKLSLLVGWALSTVAGIFAGKSAKTSGQTSDPKWSAAAVITPYIFILGLLVLPSLGVHRLVLELPAGKEVSDPAQTSMQSTSATAGEVTLEWQAADSALKGQTGSIKLKIENPSLATPRIDVERNYWCDVSQLDWRWLAAVMICMLGVSLLLSCRVDINNFSMNPLYRNRLVRCYLGATRPDAERGCSANPFTGFDPGDDTFLANFSEEQYVGPYPLICATLNVTHGKRLAWQERKAESFIFSPKYCGFEYVGMEDAQRRRKRAANSGYQLTDQYGYPKSGFDASHENRGGVRLGTVMSISGAAASPNMGYHTSAPLAFLMTIFNVRLGWWLPNPRYGPKDFWIPPHGGPRLSLLYLLCELFATTTDLSKYVYLSDGGHFENLGIYELVRRRCKYIIACDASADEKMIFGDLGNAIRKCRSDFGVEIMIDPTPVKLPIQTSCYAEAHGVLGSIHYPELSREEPGFVGRILYVKPTITKGVPRDVLAYREKQPAFPNQTTADQWFDESQFESYRRLGLYSFEWLTGTAGQPGPPLTFPAFFELLKEKAS